MRARNAREFVEELTSDPETIVKVAHSTGVAGAQIFNYLCNGLSQSRAKEARITRTSREGRSVSREDGSKDIATLCERPDLTRRCSFLLRPGDSVVYAFWVSPTSRAPL